MERLPDRMRSPPCHARAGFASGSARSRAASAQAASHRLPLTGYDVTPTPLGSRVGGHERWLSIAETFEFLPAEEYARRKVHA